MADSEHRARGDGRLPRFEETSYRPLRTLAERRRARESVDTDSSRVQFRTKQGRQGKVFVLFLRWDFCRGPRRSFRTGASKRRGGERNFSCDGKTGARSADHAGQVDLTWLRQV